MTPAGRIAVVHPYWDFWESSVDGDLRADRLDLLEQACAVLGERQDIVASGLVSEPADATAFLESCPPVDAVVMLLSMAVPPATGMALLDRMPGTPVVVWAAGRHDAQVPEFSHSDITTAGATVGAPMLGSALARAGRHFDLVASTLQTPGRIQDAVHQAAAAGRLRGSSILRVGGPMPGYTTVHAPDQEIAAIGPRMVDIDPAELSRLAHVASADDVAARLAEIAISFDGIGRVDAEGLERTVRAEVALRAIVADHGIAAGAINCHVAALRPSAEFGIAPCLALGRLTTDGIPFTCTGDTLAAVAMLALQVLGHPGLYHEIEALDHEADEALLANSGEHDLRLCGSTRPDLVGNVWYEKDPITAPCARFALPAGPASLVAFVFAPTPRFVVAEGEFTGRTSIRTGTPNAGFRFDSGPVGTAWARWGASGVTHHSAATNARVAAEVTSLAAHLGVHVVVV